MSWTMSADEDASITTASTVTAPPMSPSEQPSFDLGAKLAQRLREHSADRDRTQRRIDQETTQLQHLFKSAPKRPRETKAALQQKAKKLERDRTSRSLPLAQEKALIRQIDATQKQIRQLGQIEQHQQLIRKKKADIEASREALRIINISISQIQTALSKVELGKKLGCLPSEVITREIDCPMNKLTWVIGKDGENIKDIEESEGVQIKVDKIRGKIQIRGSDSAVDDAILRLENFTMAVDEELKTSPDVIAYLLTKQSEVLNKTKEDNPDVKIDVLSKVILIRGHPDNVKKAKGDIGAIQIVTQSRLLVGRESSLVVGKIHSMSDSHGVVMDQSKDGVDKLTVRIIGPSTKVDAAIAEIDKLLFDMEELEESISVNALIKSELLGKAGAAIKEFERSLSTALTADNPEVGGASLQFDKTTPKEGTPKLILRCSRCVMDRAKSLVLKKIDEFDSNVMSIDISSELIPIIVGKGGATINELRKEGAGATIEADASAGVIKVYSPDVATREAIQQKVEQIIAENQVGYIPIEKLSISYLLGSPGEEVRKACTEIGCTLTMSNDDSKLMIKGTDEGIEQVSELLKEFLAKNFIAELDIASEDEPLLFMGKDNSILNKVEAKHDVKTAFRKVKNLLQIRGEAEQVSAALEDVKQFFEGGNGMSVCKFKVPEEAVGGVIGKGGSNISKLETDFEGVLIHIPKDNNTVSIRGPEDMVKQVRTRVITTIATTSVTESIDISPEQHEELVSFKSDVIKRVSRFTNAKITLNETSIKVRGISADVRDAKANINEYLKGIYHGFIDLEASQFSRVKSTMAKNPAHLERIHTSSGADVTLEDSDYTIKISGKRSNVKKAKTLVMELLTFMLPSQLQTVKVHRSLFKSMGDPGKLAQIATDTGASISLDRDMNCILIRSDNSSDCDKAVQLVNTMLEECQKLNVVMRFSTDDAWLFPIIIGKGGSTIKKLSEETECSFDVFKDESNVVITADSEEILQAGKEALERIISQARKECVFIELPESSVPSFIGKGGAGIKQLSADNDVQVERSRKHPSTIKITGKEDCVALARSAVSSWIQSWEAKNVGVTMSVEERLIPLIIGKGGETVRSIEKETGCTLDVNRQRLTLTVRGGSDTNRESALNKIQALIDEEEAKAAAKAAAMAKLRDEQAEIAKVEANKMAESNATAPKPGKPPKKIPDADSAQDRSGEFPNRPVGIVEVLGKRRPELATDSSTGKGGVGPKPQSAENDAKVGSTEKYPATTKSNGGKDAVGKDSVGPKPQPAEHDAEVEGTENRTATTKSNGNKDAIEPVRSKPFSWAEAVGKRRPESVTPLSTGKGGVGPKPQFAENDAEVGTTEKHPATTKSNGSKDTIGKDGVGPKPQPAEHDAEVEGTGKHTVTTKSNGNKDIIDPVRSKPFQPDNVDRCQMLQEQIDECEEEIVRMREDHKKEIENLGSTHLQLNNELQAELEKTKKLENEVGALRHINTELQVSHDSLLAKYNALLASTQQKSQEEAAAATTQEKENPNAAESPSFRNPCIHGTEEGRGDTIANDVCPDSDSESSNIGDIMAEDVSSEAGSSEEDDGGEK